MKNALSRLAVLGLFLAGLNSFALFAASSPNRIIVKFKGGGTRNLGQTLDQRIQSLSQRRAAAELGSLTKQSRLSGNLALIRFSTALDSIEAARSLRTDPQVEYAQPDYVLHAFVEAKKKNVQGFATIFGPPPGGGGGGGQPDIDPPYQPAPPLPSIPVIDSRVGEAYGIAAIHAVEAWELQKGNRTVIVADIDTGIDYNHEDLMNNLWTNPDPSAVDRHGFDFANNDPAPYDDNGHGTHTAGTIGATGGNGVGLSGVAQAVALMTLKFLSGQGSGTTSAAVLSIDYAIQHGARIMSNSWGGGASPGEENNALIEAVERANTANILFVAAAGNSSADNDTNPVFPATIAQPNVLAVAATTSTDDLAKFSNYGATTVHVGAPGDKVMSTMPGNKYAEESGTSMACPHVAGLAALLLAHNPTLTALQLKQIIMDSVDVIPALQGKTVSGGRINARAALERARFFGVE